MSTVSEWIKSPALGREHIVVAILFAFTVIQAAEPRVAKTRHQASGVEATGTIIQDKRGYAYGVELSLENATNGTVRLRLLIRDGKTPTPVGLDVKGINNERYSIPRKKIRIDIDEPKFTSVILKQGSQHRWSVPIRDVIDDIEGFPDDANARIDLHIGYAWERESPAGKSSGALAVIHLHFRDIRLSKSSLKSGVMPSASDLRLADSGFHDSSGAGAEPLKARHAVSGLEAEVKIESDRGGAAFALDVILRNPSTNQPLLLLTERSVFLNVDVIDLKGNFYTPKRTTPSPTHSEKQFVFSDINLDPGAERKWTVMLRDKIQNTEAFPQEMAGRILVNITFQWRTKRLGELTKPTLGAINIDVKNIKMTRAALEKNPG